MHLLTSAENLAAFERSDLAKLICFHCKKTFLLEKFRVERCIKRGTGKYCSRTCARHATRTSKEVFCANCQTLFRKHAIEIKRTATHFCSRSCSTKYNNRLKKLGVTRRSKAEDYFCSLIQKDFPNLKILQNSRDFLPSNLEIDILIPEYKLAIELNGPIHYLPIYGDSKLKKVQMADKQKQVEIQNMEYKLLIIDISNVGYFRKVKLMLDEYYLRQVKPIFED